ncbi:MAG TPA: dephospho-CoA kinase [Solirubrobacteraceae bacterium]|nr:dephospho-CoA kinase [Solirubrobacteraceae bacterium]
MSAAVPFVGLTGGMGAGKSTALQALRELGAEVISSDDVVHELYWSPEVVGALSGRFGPEVAPGGQVDRPELARRAFATPEDRAWLEGLVWPLVGERIGAWLERARSQRPSPRAAVVEVPLLFEAGLQDGYDATIAVLADESLRRSRAAARGQVLLDERDARQLSQQEKAQRATFVVRNDGTEQDLARQLSEVLDKLDRR